MGKKIIKFIRITFVSFFALVFLILSIVTIKGYLIYSSSWDNKNFRALNWNDYSDEFKTVAVSEFSSQFILTRIVRLTMSKYTEERKMRTIEWHFFSIITQFYCNFFVSDKEALSNILNYSYLGENVIGFSNGSKFYLHKNIKEIDLAESALLIAVSFGPNYFNPFKNIERVYQRRNIILEKLEKSGISSELIKKSKMQTIHLSPPAL